jgi:arylsulfatase A-like enzyme
LALSEITIAEAFKEAGYATFMSGKWHLGNEGFLPKDQGFTTDASAATGPKTRA